MLFRSYVYSDVQPQGEGNMTFGLYADASCSEFAQYNMTEYIRFYFRGYYRDQSMGNSEAAGFDRMIETWNDYMRKWKICQPCQSYSLQVTTSDNDDGDGNERRFLGGNNDGGCEEESNGYNCYDDAGYLNCNQVREKPTK